MNNDKLLKWAIIIFGITAVLSLIDIVLTLVKAL